VFLYRCDSSADYRSAMKRDISLTLSHYLLLSQRSADVVETGLNALLVLLYSNKNVSQKAAVKQLYYACIILTFRHRHGALVYNPSVSRSVTVSHCQTV